MSEHHADSNRSSPMSASGSESSNSIFAGEKAAIVKHSIKPIPTFTLPRPDSEHGEVGRTFSSVLLAPPEAIVDLDAQLNAGILEDEHIESGRFVRMNDIELAQTEPEDDNDNDAMSLRRRIEISPRPLMKHDTSDDGSADSNSGSWGAEPSWGAGSSSGVVEVGDLTADQVRTVTLAKRDNDLPSNTDPDTLVLRSKMPEEMSIDKRAELARQIRPYRALLKRGKKLGELRATAICGNDCTGSLFYMVGQTSLEGGVFAPIGVVLVMCVLQIFRNIYGEAVTSLPINGGAYNVLLNTTKKSTAAVAAVLTLLSYTATAVVSAAEAMHYLQRATNFPSDLITWGTILLLILFAVLSFIGIGESAGVAFGIFAIHIVTMSVLVMLCIIYIFRGAAGNLSAAESGEGFPNFWLHSNYEFTVHILQPKVGLAIFYGFSAAMLGVTGFESSANFVEEQKPGVFLKTLRNMWILCAVFNTTLSFMGIWLLDLVSVIGDGNIPTMIALLANHVGGSVFDHIVCIDACLVLAGGVLTSYVGVTGLVRRLAMDRCFPQFFLQQNPWRKTNHWIFISFCTLCCSMYLVLDGDVKSLSQTYSLAFLFVMTLFALGVLLIKTKRSTLVAEVYSTWGGAICAAGATCVAVVGAILRDPSIAFIFCVYFFTSWLLILAMLCRVQLLRLGALIAMQLPWWWCSSLRRPMLTPAEIVAEARNRALRGTGMGSGSGAGTGSSNSRRGSLGGVAKDVVETEEDAQEIRDLANDDGDLVITGSSAAARGEPVSAGSDKDAGVQGQQNRTNGASAAKYGAAANTNKRYGATPEMEMQGVMGSRLSALPTSSSTSSLSALGASAAPAPASGENSIVANGDDDREVNPDYKWSIAQFLVDIEESICASPIGFFTKNGDLAVLNKAILYIRDNEDCAWIRVIHIFDSQENIPKMLAHNVHILNDAYPKFRIDLVLVKGYFSPATVAYCSVRLGIARNNMFITTPQPGFQIKLDNLGGVRLITQ